MKKVILWGVYLGFVAVLVLGAVNRTAAKSQGSKREQQLVAEDRNNDENYTGFAERDGSGRETANPDSDPGEPVGDTKRDHDVTGYYATSEENHDWLEFGGVVAQVDEFSIFIEGENEKSIEISRQAYRFAVELGYSPAVGDEVLLTGFFEDGEFEVGAILDEHSGQVWVFRDKTGRPMWAGSGN